MSNVPVELKYAASHEWVRDNEDGTITVGITDHAQAMLGDLVFVELPDVEATFNQGDGIVIAESVKAASDIFAPMDGEVVEVNEALIELPELVNSDPYGDGWLFKLKVDDIDMLAALMDAQTYADGVEEDDA